MANTITVKFTPLPNGMELRNGKTFLNVSVFISPEITPDVDDHNRVLREFPVFLDWPGTVATILGTAGLALQVDVTGGTSIKGIVTTLGFDQQKASRIWSQIFRPELPVHHRDKFNLYSGDKNKNPTRTVLPEKSTSRNYTEYLSQYFGNKYNGATSLPDDYKNSFLTASSDTATTTTIPTHLKHQTESFNRVAGRSRHGSDESAWRNTLKKRSTLDFNHLAANLGHYPMVLRELALILDISVDVTAHLQQLTKASGFIYLTGVTTNSWTASKVQADLKIVLPQVAVNYAARQDASRPGQYIANSFTAAHDPTDATVQDLISQRLLLIKPASASNANGDDSAHNIRVDDTDAVGAAFKMKSMTQQLKNCSDTLPYSPPKTAGLALNHENLHTNTNQRLLKGYTPAKGTTRHVLYAEDLVKGYRIDARSAPVGNGSPVDWSKQPWYSLCQQELHMSGAAGLTEKIECEGWASITQTYAQSPTDAADQPPYLVVPGTLTRWEGWSLCVPRPGNGQLNDGTTSNGPSSKGYDNFDRLKIAKKVIKGSLPKLRYGYQYQFRVRTVDIAGNGLPLDPKITDPLTTDPYVTQASPFTRPEGHYSPVIVPKEQIYTLNSDAETTDQQRKSGAPSAIQVAIITPASQNVSEVTKVTIKTAKSGDKLTLSSSGIEPASDKDAAPSITYQWVKDDTPAKVAGKLAGLLGKDEAWAAAATAKPDGDTITITATSPNTFLVISGAVKEPAAENPVNVPGKEGETVDVMVVRSKCSPDSDIPEIVDLHCVRHILPPQISPDLAEKAGMFDGKGSFESFNMIVSHDEVVDPSGYADQTWLPVPYLPDNEIKAFQIGGDGIDAKKYLFFFYDSEWKWPNAKPWKLVLEPVRADEPFEIVRPADSSGIIRVRLPQSQIRKIQLTAVCTHGFLKNKSYLFSRLFSDKNGLSRITSKLNSRVGSQGAEMTMESEPVVGVSTLANDANLHYLSDDLFPPKCITLVHAVQKALDQPVIKNLQFVIPPAANPGDVRLTNNTYIQLTLKPQSFQAASSDKLDVFGRWYDFEDKNATFGQTQTPLDKKIYEFELNYTDMDALINPVFRHELGDTQRRRVAYRIDNGSRYGAYFNKRASLIRPGSQAFNPDEKGSITIDIPSSQAPLMPVINRVVPVYSHEYTSREFSTTVKQLSGNGIRVYLDRGSWYSSGVGEVLGVVVPDQASVVAFSPDLKPGTVDQPAPFVTLDKHFISLVGKDVTRNTGDVQLLSVNNFINNITQAELPGRSDWFKGYYRWMPEAANSDKVDSLYLIPEVKKKGDSPDASDIGTRCRVVRYDVSPTADGSNELYADILFTGLNSYFPFIRLVLVRLQPAANSDCHVSAAVQLDYCQLPSNRTVTVHHSLGRIDRIQIDTNAQANAGNVFYVAVEKMNPFTEVILKQQKTVHAGQAKKRPEIGRLYLCVRDAVNSSNWIYQRPEDHDDGLPYDIPVDHQIVIYEFENYNCDPAQIIIDPLNDNRMRLVSMESVKII